MDTYQKDCLKQNRPYLQKTIDLSNELLCVLSSKDVITDEHLEQLQKKKRYDTMTSAVLHLLSEILPKRKPEAFHQFLEDLRCSGQDHVAETLENWLKKNKSNYEQASTSRATPTKPSTKRMSGSEDQRDDSLSIIDHLLSDIENSPNIMKIKLQERKMSIGGDQTKTEECYEVNRKPRGVAVIINNANFKNKFETRDSSLYDVTNMENLLRKLHFEVKKHMDKDAQGIIKCLEDERSNLPKSDIFVAVIMSHGSKNCVYGTDGESVQIEEITNIFNGTKCPILKDTPKVFFIQACQGNERVTSGSAKSVGASQHDGSSVTEPQGDGTDLNLDETDSEPTERNEPEKAHQVVVSSTTPGDTAWRHSDLGSPFIRAIVAVFNRFAHLEHLLDMITMVTHVMLQWSKKHQQAQICEKRSATFSKKLYFYP